MIIVAVDKNDIMFFSEQQRGAQASKTGAENYDAGFFSDVNHAIILTQKFFWRFTVRYIATPKKAVGLTGLTSEQAIKKLKSEVNFLEEEIQKHFPSVVIINKAWISTMVLLEIPDEKTAEEIAKVCNCNVKKPKPIERG